tara:strand:- start:4894 stop:5076 length:183 start_codon:yes stop_codon:yes gene_type:complete
MEKQNLKNEIKELKNIIIHLVISLFKDKKISEKEALDLLADAVTRNEKQKQEAYKNEWRL